MNWPLSSEDGRPRLLLAVTHPMTADLLMRGLPAYLSQHGFEVAVAAAPGPHLERVGEREGVTTFAVPMRRQPAPGSDLTALVRAIAVLRRFRPHLVNAGTPKAGLLFTLAAQLTAVPHRLYTVRGLRLETASGWRRQILTLSERTAAACAHRVVCVSNSLRRRYLDLGLATETKVETLGDGSSNGVDTKRFHPHVEAEPETLALRQELGIPADAPVVGFVGRFTRDKGFGELAAAFANKVAPAFPSAHLLLIGDHEAGDPVPKGARRHLDDHPRVVTTGFVAETAPYYRLMDVLAFPSHREGFPNAPLEAAASGVPTVGYAATGTVDAVEDGVTGVLVPVGDGAAFGEALTTYLADPGRRRRHGGAARRRAVERFGQQQVWQAWRKLYAAELTARPDRP